MIDILKSLIPNALTIVGVAIEYLAAFINGIAALLVGISVILHKLLRTEVGLKLIAMEESVNKIVAMYTNIAKQIEESKTTGNKESNKLAAVAKSDANVVQLGKKKDDNSDS